MKTTAFRQAGDEDIQKMLKMAFWDRTIAPAAWRQAIRRGEIEVCRNVISASFKHLPVRWFVRQMGEDVFIKRWPVLRTVLADRHDPIAIQRLEAWDTLWGILAVGDSQYPVRAEIANMGRKKRGLLKAIVHNGISSTYELAKSSGRDYGRVHKDVRSLVDAGLISLRREKTAENRAINILEPRFSVNGQLAAMMRQPECAAVANEDSGEPDKSANNSLFGIGQEDEATENVDAYVRNLRKGRFRDREFEEIPP